MPDEETVEPTATDLAIDASIVAKLVANHREFLRFLERRLGDRAEAEEILQQAFVKGLEHGDALRESEASVAWFYRTLRNAVIDRHRRQGAASRALVSFAQELERASAAGDELKGAVCACVRSLSDTLKPEYAEALQRIDVDGMSVQAFAEALGISAGNAAVRVHRAREALRKRVTRACGTCAEHGCLDCTCGGAGTSAGR